MAKGIDNIEQQEGILKMASDLFLLLQQLSGATIRPPSRLLALAKSKCWTGLKAASASMGPGPLAEAIPESGCRYHSPQMFVAACR